MLYSKPSLVIVLKEFKCMCVSYFIINQWPLMIEIYEYVDEFINLCTLIDAWCILVFIKHKILNIWRSWSWLMSLKCWCKETVFKTCIITRELCKFLIENLIISKLQFFSIYSFPYVFLDPHRNFHVGRELTKIFFLFVQMWDNVVYVNPCFKM